MSLYVYCVVPKGPTPLVSAAGVQDQPSRIFPLESLDVIVSDFSGSEWQPKKEDILAHERVIESWMEQATPLPFRFGVIVSEQKLTEFVLSHASELHADLEKVRDCVEMGLKVMLPATQTQGSSGRTGTEFLAAKRELQELQINTAAWVEDAVVGIIRQTDVSLLQGSGSAIVRIEHLVPRDLLNEYKVRIDALVRQRTNHAFLRSGPWPPYAFISATSLG